MDKNNGYTILEAPEFVRAVRKNLPVELRKILYRKIEYLAQNPRHPSLNTKKLAVNKSTLNRIGADEVWEFRINMSFRCVYYVVHSKRRLILVLAGNHDIVTKRFPN